MEKTLSFCGARLKDFALFFIGKRGGALAAAEVSPLFLNKIKIG